MGGNRRYRSSYSPRATGNRFILPTHEIRHMAGKSAVETIVWRGGGREAIFGLGWWPRHESVFPGMLFWFWGEALETCSRES
jgi:hypothetical protein